MKREGVDAVIARQAAILYARRDRTGRCTSRPRANISEPEAAVFTPRPTHGAGPGACWETVAAIRRRIVEDDIRGSARRTGRDRDSLPTARRIAVCPFRANATCRSHETAVLATTACAHASCQPPQIHRHDKETTRSTSSTAATFFSRPKTLHDRLPRQNDRRGSGVPKIEGRASRRGSM